MTQDLIFCLKLFVNEVDPIKIRRIIDSAVSFSEYQVLKFAEHYFNPQGYTCIWLLAESHCAVHTFPDKGVSYIELSGCNMYKNQLFYTRLLYELKAIKKKIVSR